MDITDPTKPLVKEEDFIVLPSVTFVGARSLEVFSSAPLNLVSQFSKIQIALNSYCGGRQRISLITPAVMLVSSSLSKGNSMASGSGQKWWTLTIMGT